MRHYRSAIGYVQQDPVLFSTTIFENIAFGLVGSDHEHAPPDKIRELVEAAAVTANADTFVRALKDGYQQRIGERGLLLSGGCVDGLTFTGFG